MICRTQMALITIHYGIRINNEFISTRRFAIIHKSKNNTNLFFQFPNKTISSQNITCFTSNKFVARNKGESDVTDDEVSFREILNKHIEFLFNFPNNHCTGRWQKDEHSAPCRWAGVEGEGITLGEYMGQREEGEAENILIQCS